MVEDCLLLKRISCHCVLIQIPTLTSWNDMGIGCLRATLWCSCSQLIMPCFPKLFATLFWLIKTNHIHGGREKAQKVWKCSCWVFVLHGSQRLCWISLL
jgi:hypothetical protein